MQNIYGVLIDGIHYDTSKTENGAKIYATQNGYDKISIRYNGGYVVEQIAQKNSLGKWISK